ncbi:peptide ABC transporter ATP-binding protein [Candidatus Epulonipiscioides gigas]|nr:peptide ABC transporter ATP-binding protein [Epulopiscium sp. SCG-C07WGA-EpuloA2]
MIKVSNLCMDFRSELNGKKQRVLKNLNFNVRAGDCLGVLGESGSGKSTLGRILIGLLKPTSGEYLFENINPYQDKHNKHHLSEHVSVVFQDYVASVNPRFTVAEIIKESLNMLAKKQGKLKYIDEEISKLLKMVGLDDTYKNRFPHQLSGGQLQRVCIGRALALKPSLILFDEAISSLDAHTQVQIMDLLKKLQEQLNLTYIFITHDLMSVTYMCDKVMFLYNGEITECIKVDNIAQTTDDYAKKLLSTAIYI